MIPIPYVSQQGNIPRNDCGPACALMLARWNGKGLDANVTDWSKSISLSLTSGGGKKARKGSKKKLARARSIDLADDGTTPQDLGGMLSQLGLTPAFGGAAQYPYIELVQYALLPPENRLVTNKDFLHWIVRLDDTTYHDPYHSGTNGANLKASKDVLDAAEAGAHNRVGVAERPSPDGVSVTPEWLAPTDYVRLRRTPDANLTDNIIARLEIDRPVLAHEAASDSQGRMWRRIRISARGLRSAANTERVFEVEGWAASWLMTPASEPGHAPTPPLQGQRYIPNDFLRLRASPDDDSANTIAVLELGKPVATFESQPDAKGRGEWRRVRVPVPGLVTEQDTNAPYAIDGWAAGWFMDPEPGGGDGDVSPTRGPLLGVNALYFADLALDAAARGCRFFMIMNDFGAAHRLKQQYPAAVVMVRRYWGKSVPSIEDAIAGMEVQADSRLVYTFLNECDAICYGTPDEIRHRAQLDVALAQAIKAIAPNAKYAAGTFSHGTPDFTNPEIVRAMRDHYAPHYNSGLFGLDLHNYTFGRAGEVDPIWYETRWRKLFTDCGFDPAIREIYAGETGIEGGRGGFPEHGYSDEDFRAWCEWHQQIEREPLIVDDQSYPSPYIGGAIFQLGDDTRSIERAAQEQKVFGKLYRQWLAYARKRGLIDGPDTGRRSRGGWGHYNIRRYLSVLQEFWK
jgi:hypothetical protein